MASTSASSVQRSFKYDVFLSFRGEDTRKTFVDHLYLALVNKGIITYKDDEKIEKGKRINDQLIRSIQDSRFHIIVFSKNYASSSWCLDELVEIMKCQRTTEHTAYPIFYDVEPTEVRNQSGAVGEAFAKLVAKHEKEEADGKWRDALIEASTLAGRELKTTFDGHEAKFIQQIVQDMSPKLHFINLSIDGKLVGMETRVKNVLSSLEIGSDDVRLIGIKGIGGGGKTTLAKAVFDHISILFEGNSFVENVREVSNGSLSGLVKLQNQVLNNVLNDQSIVVTSVLDGKNIMKRIMSCTKVLVVLDDVDDIGQLEALAGEPTWFKPGSRIIITTRDEQLLVAHRVNFIHDVNLLSDQEAICLFSRYAFGRDIPIQGYEEPSKKVVHYSGGLPLTIKVLGSFLCGRSEREWEDALERLKTIPLKETLEKLELSYNGLDDDQKEIFLDVVCILKGETKDRAMRILESCGFHAQIGLRVLEQKSLITISQDDGLRFHDHIEEMGWNIVRRLHLNKPSRHTRLWIKEELEDILVHETGTKATRSIKMKNMDLHLTIIMKGLRKMRELRSLYVDDIYSIRNVDELSHHYLPDALRSLYWPLYPFQSLPKTFRANKLVNLEMEFSNITQLWEGGKRKVLDKLRYVDLMCSKLRFFDLGMTPHLEKLNLQGCKEFIELHLPIKCPNLKFLNLSLSMVSNLNLGMIPHLEKLNLRGCREFVQLHLPVECLNLKFLDLSLSMVSNLNLGMIPHLEKLNLRGCREFVQLHLPVECLNLKFLCLSGSKVSKLNLGRTPHLEALDLEICSDFVEILLPVEFPNIISLCLSGFKVSNLNLGMTPQSEILNLAGCNDFVEPHFLVGLCPNLKILYLSGDKLSKLNLGLTPNLEQLVLKRCIDFAKLHMPFECEKLKFLMLASSKVRTLNLWMTPHLERLDLKGCYCLQEIHAPVGSLEKLVYLNLSGCWRFEHFLVDKEAKSTNLDSVPTLELIAESLDICRMHPNNNLPKFRFICKYDEPPGWSGNLEKLISFGLCACTNLESFSKSICSLQGLRVLTLEGSIPEVPKDLGQLESLEKLTLWMKEINHLPESICMLKHLKSLNLKSCWLLKQLPMDLGRLEGLEELNLRDCISLRDIPNNICKLKSLIYLNLGFCILVEKLPEEIGCLVRLKELDIEGTFISRLPQSLYQLKGLRIIGSTGAAYVL